MATAKIFNTPALHVYDSMSIFSDIVHILQDEETFPTLCFAGQFPALGHAPCVETADGRQPIVHPKWTTW